MQLTRSCISSQPVFVRCFAYCSSGQQPRFPATDTAPLLLAVDDAPIATVHVDVVAVIVA